MMHPMVRIVCLIVFGVALQLMRWPVLLACSLLMTSILYCCGGSLFMVLARRARWLLLSILMVYAYATPGEYLSGIPDAIAPTYEGIVSGLLQSWRLLAMLAALSILLEKTGRENFMVGVYQLMQPLRILGLSPDRFAVRIWLTLHYVESMPHETIGNLRRNGWTLEFLCQAKEGPCSVQLNCPRLKLPDVMILLALPFVFWILA